MKLEQAPIVLGVIVCLIAIAILYDALAPEAARPFRERRRRPRAEMNTAGELMVGLGTACLGAALIGRDDWRWGTISIIAGVTLLALGGIINRAFLREMLLFRGASRRAEETETPPGTPKSDAPRLRIR